MPYERSEIITVPFYAVPIGARFSVTLDGTPHMANRLVADRGISLYGYQPFAEILRMVLTDDGRDVGLMPWTPCFVPIEIYNDHVHAGNVRLAHVRILRDFMGHEVRSLPTDMLFWSARLVGL
jgi:hypothetical protein